MNISFSTNDDKNDFLYSNGPQNNGILQLFNKHLFSRASLLSIENGLLEKFNKTLGGKVATNINPLTTYVAAEDYHQKYIMKNRR